ncbi:MAG: ATP-dependent DNA helicase RecG, partial [Lachnospiraceae bacterium]|nr:ATP-dependent DNA helicase RecG [Lachnospiraceae bacterium]
LGTDVSHLKGVGEKTAALFKKLNIQTYEDLFSYYPTDYIRYNPPVSFSDLRAGSVFTVRGLAASVSGPVKAGRYSIITVILKDGLNTLEAVFFNQPFIKKVIKVGGYYILRGKIVQKGAKLIMQSPKLFKEDEYRELVKYPQAKYSRTAGLSSKTVSKALKAAFTDAQWGEECFPKKYLESLNLPSHKDAIRLIHFPECDEDIAFARRRLSFEEFFYFIMLLRKNKQISVSTPNNFRMIETAETKRFLESLPFKPTAGQKKAWKDILDDMCGERCMNRLIQGDVGSGKTLIALLSLLLAASNGYQGALMAPTEVLAVQHFKTVNEYISKYGLIFKPVLLTGQMKAADRREALAKIESGEANLIIGTHALIQEKVSYKNLALVVTDEQHRFGVRQRQALASKGKEPHILVMSATPIPRTLAIILYGDLQLSAIHELPAGRSAIKNAVVGMSYRPSAYKFFKDQIAQGHQVYVICPKALSDEEDDGELENVIDYAAKLREILPGVSIEHLNGKMKAQEKTDIMQRFSRGETDILVSTTVIEVGINVPNATVMMIENAERFGLSQLHQLRGRVGRGSAQSYCIFISSKEDDKIMERLNVLKSTNDGFKIASEDLRLRGPGDFFGVRQSGEFAFKIADIYSDSDLLESAGNLVDEILKDDPRLERSENRLIKEQVDYFFEHSELFTSI